MKTSILLSILVLIFIPSLNCEKTSPTDNEKTTKNTVTDIDGNTYRTIKIGDQLWMAENLRVTHYRNGDEIPNIIDGKEWSNLKSGAYCDYNNNPSNTLTYGRLYNWYAVSDIRSITPDGWHVPTDEEWKILEKDLGMSQAQVDSLGNRGTDEGGKLKDIGLNYWIEPNTAATNESGFSALPAGFRYVDGNFLYMGENAAFWSIDAYDEDYVWMRNLSYWYPNIYRYYFYKTNGFSVRLVKD